MPAPSGQADLWPTLRRQLEAAALIEAETLPGVAVPFLRFHPTLAPMLWVQLDADEQARLNDAHRRRYYAVANYLYRSDDKAPHETRAIARRELPNLLYAVHAALDAGDPQAVDFADSVNLFLNVLGLKQESEALVAKFQAAAGEAGSSGWYLAQSNRGEQLRTAGRTAEATVIFRAILEKLGDAPSYGRAVALGCLGRCFFAGGRPDLAVQQQRAKLAVLEQLEQTDDVKREGGVYLTDLADSLSEQGQYAEARKAYEDGLAVDQELNDLRGQGVTLGQLGTLAMREGKLDEAVKRYRAALALFQQLHEPAMVAVAWHQLGRVFEETRQWNEAERQYREAARIKEKLGMISGPNGATTTWNHLAIVSESAGKLDAAESWYRKAIEGFKAIGDTTSPSKALSNLASLLVDLPGRLAEARQLAEEALAINKTLDPGAAKIWMTYNILAQIAEKEAEGTADSGTKAELQAQAREHRRLAREAKRNFAGTRQELWKYTQLIVATVAACAGQEEACAAVAKQQQAMRQGGPGWANAADVLDRLLAGERDAEALCDGLGPDESMVIEAILQAVADPSTLKDLLPDQEQE